MSKRVKTTILLLFHSLALALALAFSLNSLLAGLARIATLRQDWHNSVGIVIIGGRSILNSIVCDSDIPHCEQFLSPSTNVILLLSRTIEN